MGRNASVLLLAAMACCVATPEAGQDGGTFRDPDLVVPDANGVYAMNMMPSKVMIDGKPYCLRTYGGKVSPMIRVDASSQPRRIRVDVTNDFTKMDEQSVSNGSCPGAAEKHHFNLTNFHTHGLHVSPERTADGAFESDNVLLDIPPGSPTVQYRFDLDEPSTHEAGTYWFHSHIHGSTAIQVANGVAGALILRGAVDELPGIKEAKERVFLFQQIPYDYVDEKDPGKSVKPLEGECTEDTLSVNQFAAVTGAKHTLINGVVAPTINVHKNQVERWRFIHAGISAELTVGLRRQNTDGTCNYAADDTSRAVPVHQIAADGFTYAAAETMNQVVLEPGYRADVMMKAPATAGTYCILDIPQTVGLAGPEDGNVLGYLNVDDVEASPGTGALPADADLKKVARPVLDCAAALTSQPRPMVFAQQKDRVTNALCEGECPTGSPFFNVNCKKFDAKAPPTPLPFGETEEWLLSSESFDHPFHIHVNPFTVCAGSKVRGEVVQTPHWKDTLFVRSADTSTGAGTDAMTTTPVRVRMVYEDFKGKFVMHCHKLNHEDEGMMQVVEIK